MKKSVLVISLGLAFSFFSGCVNNPKLKNAYLKRRARRVRVIKEYPKNCENVGTIIGVSTYNASGKVVWRYAMNDLRNKAAAKNIFTVVLDNYKHSSSGSYLTIRLYGKLLECKGSASPRGRGYSSPRAARPPKPKKEMARPGEVENSDDDPEDSTADDEDVEDNEEEEGRPPRPSTPDF